VAFANRVDAGRVLAAALATRDVTSDVLVLGLPRGGVPVAAEVARALHAPLDVFVVRKLGVPGHRELAFGAVASGGVRVLNDEVIRQARVSPEDIDRITAEESAELTKRERRYRGAEAFPAVQGRTVLIVDDGMATGATMRAALTAVREMGAAKVICCVPVASSAAVARMLDVCDDVVCSQTPRFFRSVGEHYADFDATTDDEVRSALSNSAD
jgi:putative phosphoribosyl transferase